MASSKVSRAESGAPPGTKGAGRPAAGESDLPGRLLREAVKYDREGQASQAVERYNAAMLASDANHDDATKAEALRRLAVLSHRSGNPAAARDLCQQSHDLAAGNANDSLAAEALNALAGFELESGEIDKAGIIFQRALELGGVRNEIRSRIEQNLGIIANIRGDLPAALAHYECSLEASRSAGDDRGCAIAYHNLGMVSADLKRWDEADRYFHRSHYLAELVNDTHLGGLCLLNWTEVHLARRQFEEARRCAEQALVIFNELNATLDKADAYKMLGTVFRETGQPTLAESRLRTAIELAVGTGEVLSEAEATRELAVLFQGTGRNQEALAHLNTAHRLFGRLQASVDLVDVASKVQNLESTYMAVVRDWGQSIESADFYTHGHCERVASFGVAVAEAMGLDEASRTAIRLGAYLHDVGKVKVPHEILNKPARLTAEEFDVIKKHPEWGCELIAGIDFPWDIIPIIRWHHEKYDGSGYPDRLAGDAIPLSAQIICVVDVYDALTTTRSYRSAMTRQQALDVMQESKRWWRADVYEAFQRTMAA
jgi:putative nucleotidyltransferase with HDIG domain